MQSGHICDPCVPCKCGFPFAPDNLGLLLSSRVVLFPCYYMFWLLFVQHASSLIILHLWRFFWKNIYMASYFPLTFSQIYMCRNFFNYKSKVTFLVAFYHAMLLWQVHDIIIIKKLVFDNRKTDNFIDLLQ